MESTKTPLKINYVVYSTVRKLERVKGTNYMGGVGADAVFEPWDRGWFVYLEGSYEAIHMGFEQPPFVVGDKIKITFEKVT